MRRGKVILASACISILVFVLVLAPSFTAFNGGVGTSEQEYCGTGCHDTLSSAVVTMEASDLTVTPASAVTVTVTVTGGTTASILGVMLVSTLGEFPESLPSADGWTITTDPSGSTAFNYYEISSYTGSGTFEWSLTAPTTEGVYVIYARVLHDGPAAVDYTTGLTFVVGDIAPPGAPAVTLTSPPENAEVEETITVSANVISEEPLAYVVLRIDGVEAGNKTAGPFSWNIDTTIYTDGSHMINVTAVDTSGNRGYDHLTIDISNTGGETELLGWVWTMAAGSFAIIGGIAMIAVIVLAVRKKKVSGRLK